MEIISYRQPAQDQCVYTLTIDGVDLMRAKLTPWDMRVLDDCDASDATIADKLLGLELLARRIEEGYARQEVS